MGDDNMRKDVLYYWKEIRLATTITVEKRCRNGKNDQKKGSFWGGNDIDSKPPLRQHRLLVFSTLPANDVEKRRIR